MRLYYRRKSSEEERLDSCVACSRRGKGPLMQYRHDEKQNDVVVPRTTTTALKFSATPGRARRSDAGTTKLTTRDVWALTWIGEQYGIRLDHLCHLLGQRTGPGGREQGQVSDAAAHQVVMRWKKQGWIVTGCIQADAPMWVWLTQGGLRKVGLPYKPRQLTRLSVQELAHLYGINQVRLYDGEDTLWTGERSALHGIVRFKGHDLLHRPDGIMQDTDSDGRKTRTAVEVELAKKPTPLLREILLELLRGEDYITRKAEVGVEQAQRTSQGMRSRYTQIYYYAPPGVRRNLRRVRTRVVEQGIVTQEEAERIYVWWYPLPGTDEERTEEEGEETRSFGGGERSRGGASKAGGKKHSP